MLTVQIFLRTLGEEVLEMSGLNWNIGDVEIESEFRFLTDFPKLRLSLIIGRPSQSRG